MTDSESQGYGAQALLAGLQAGSVDVCFTNPGTSEMHFVAALDSEPGVRSILGLFEGVVTGAADGYARMAGKPACTLLHLGPGLANGLANLHNARRAHSPIVNVVGEHATYHRALDAPLTSDIAGFAAPVSGWIHTTVDSAQIGNDAVAAVEAAMAPPGQIATLILPADMAWNPAPAPARRYAAPARTPVADSRVAEVASRLRKAGRKVILINGRACTPANLELLGRIAILSDAELMGDTFVSRIARGAGRVDVPRLPYFAEQAEAALAGTTELILVDTKAPVSFFAYPGKASELTPPGATVTTLAAPGEDTDSALAALLERLGGTSTQAPLTARSQMRAPQQGALNPEVIAQALGALLPEQAIVVNEAATSGFPIPAATAGAAPHDWMDLTGGAIGMGMPAAVGAAVACPDRRVVSLQADGSAMYTVQALWTQARESLDVTTILFANRKYAILQVELMRVGALNPGPKAFDMLDLSRPDLEWVQIARGMGVPAVQVRDAQSFSTALAKSLVTEGPFLIEALI